MVEVLVMGSPVAFTASGVRQLRTGRIIHPTLPITSSAPVTTDRLRGLFRSAGEVTVAGHYVPTIAAISADRSDWLLGGHIEGRLGRRKSSGTELLGTLWGIRSVRRQFAEQLADVCIIRFPNMLVWAELDPGDVDEVLAGSTRKIEWTAKKDIEGSFISHEQPA